MLPLPVPIVSRVSSGFGSTLLSCTSTLPKLASVWWATRSTEPERGSPLAPSLTMSQAAGSAWVAFHILKL